MTVKENVINNNASTYWHYQQYDSGGMVTIDLDGNSLTSVDYVHYRGSTLPNYNSRVRNGELLPFTPWYKFKQTGSLDTGYFNFTEPGHGNGTYLSQPRAYIDFIPSESEIQGLLDDIPINLDALVQNAAANIYSSGWDALTWAVELDKTVSMVRNAKRSLLKLLKLSDPLGSWLEYRYGWRLLFYDMQDIHNASRQLSEGRQLFQRTARSLTSGSKQTVTHYSFTAGSFDIVFDDHWDYAANGHVSAVVNPPAVNINPIITAWEVIPYSFVIDWFIGVEASLQAASFFLLNPSYVASYGVKLTHRRDVSMTNISSNAGYSVDYGYSGSVTSELKIRTPTRVSLSPHILIKPDIFKGVDLIALLADFLKRNNRRSSDRILSRRR